MMTNVAAQQRFEKLVRPSLNVCPKNPQQYGAEGHGAAIEEAMEKAKKAAQ
jgi:hypothetical protein